MIVNSTATVVIKYQGISTAQSSVNRDKKLAKFFTIFFLGPVVAGFN
jgi:hypothetical protein